MPDTTKLRVLFCGAVLQNFFDLPAGELSPVWQATGAMLTGLPDLPGVKILGTLDDDETMVGTSPAGWPWTFTFSPTYLIALQPSPPAICFEQSRWANTGCGNTCVSRRVSGASS